MKLLPLLIGMFSTAILFGCSQIRHSQGTGPEMLANVDYPLRLNHSHGPDHSYVHWQLKHRGHGAVVLSVADSGVVQWLNEDPQEEHFVVRVDNTNDWQLEGGSYWMASSPYPGDCATCGTVETHDGTIRLRFLTNDLNQPKHYQIIVPCPTKMTRAATTNYDYDMMDATIVWSDTVRDKSRHQRALTR